MSVEFIHCVTLPDSIGFLYNAFAWAFSPIIYLPTMNGHFSCLMHLIMKFKRLLPSILLNENTHDNALNCSIKLNTSTIAPNDIRRILARRLVDFEYNS